MNYPIDLSILSSFKEYLDHKVVEKLDAWQNVTISLFPVDDDRLVNYKKVGGGPHQWLYDSSIVGATIADPSQFATSGWQAAKTDFKNSQFLCPSSVTEPLPEAATLAVKHFNSYLSSNDDSDLLQNTQFDFPPEMMVKNSASEANQYYAPCFFVKYSNTRNDGFELGGAEKTSFNIKVTCFAKTEAELLALGSVFRDLKNTNTMILSFTPLDEFNDLKVRPWNFHEELLSAQNSGNSVITVEESSFNPLKSDNINSKLKNTYVGLGNFGISVIRYPRQ